MPFSSVCVDASLVVRLVADPTRSEIRSLWQRWEEERWEIAAPTLIFFEVSNALYRYERQKYFSAAAGKAALEAALSLPVRLHGDALLHHQAVQFARQFDLAATYDSHYLALAHLLEVELWTCDRKFFDRVGPSLPFVQLIE